MYSFFSNLPTTNKHWIIDHGGSFELLGNIFEHPTRRHFFANTVGRVCKLDLTLRPKKEKSKSARTVPTLQKEQFK